MTHHLERADDDSFSGQSNPQLANKIHGVRIVAMKANRSHGSIPHEGFHLIDRFLWIFHEGIGPGPGYQRAIGLIAAIGKPFGDEAAAAGAQCLQPRVGKS
jgi:hypothetical protein